MNALKKALGPSVLAILVVSACGGDNDTNGVSSMQTSAVSSTGDGSTDGSTSSTTAGTTATDSSGSPTTGPSTGGTTAPGTGSTGGGAMGLDEVGSLVILGDSIGDGGGQPPFYYDLLRADLESFYGTIAYQNNAESGSETDALVGQINSLPQMLPGPVVVVVTSGGNDMKAHIAEIIAGTDGPARDQVKANIGEALDALLAPDRFGPGVEVFVFEGDVYDASDGAGDYGQNGCAFGQGLPAIPTDAFFDNWNTAIHEAVQAPGQTAVDMHGYFYGHGYNGDENWYAADCTHPNSLGHDELRQLFYEHVTGEPY